MELTREKALELHLQMWSDMQDELGDTPTGEERENYKERWCRIKFPNQRIAYRCFLCEYALSISSKRGGNKCSKCPVNWNSLANNNDEFRVNFIRCVDDYMGREETSIYLDAPISEILALPEREDI